MTAVVLTKAFSENSRCSENLYKPLYVGLGAAVLSALAPVPLHSQGDRDRPDFEVYGFVFAQAVIDANQTGRDRFLNIQPAPGALGVENREADFFFDVLASRIGLNLFPPLGSDGRNVTGKVEIDFDTPSGAPRFRHAFAELRSGSWSLLAGQTWSIVSQLNPETLNSDNLYNLGNTYERMPQVRFTYRSDAFEWQVGTGTFFGSFDQPSLAVQSAPTLGESFGLDSNTPPVVQSRVKYSWSSDNNIAPYVGISGSVGRVRTRGTLGSEGTVTHYLFVGEISLPVHGKIDFAAEVFAGQATGFNGGVGQTVFVGSDGVPDAWTSVGGFAQLTVRINSATRVNLIGGLDDPEDRLGITRNATVLANFFWNVTEDLEYAGEVQILRTEYAGAQRAENVRASLALFLRF